MASDYWTKFQEVRASRRRFLGTGAAAGVGVAGFALVGCGDDNTAKTSTAAPAGTTTAAGSASASASVAATQVAGLRGGTLRAPLSGISSADPPTIYPYENLTYLAQTPSAYHYSRLLRGVAKEGVAVEDKTVLEGDIASKFEVVDPTHYTFTLKPNIKWQNKAPMNGRAATAQDFVKAYDVFSKVSQNGPKFGAIIDKVEAPDEKTVKFTLKGPFAPFLSSIAASAEGIWFIPVETIDSGQAKEDPVGTGPFIFRSRAAGVSIKWDRNPDYYDQPYPYFDKVEAGLFNDTQRIVAGLQTGDLDISGLSGAIFKESRSKLDPKGTDWIVQNNVEGGMIFNFDNKPFNDKRVRQALSMLMDRVGMLKVQDGTTKGTFMAHLPPAQAPYFLDPKDATKFGPNAKFYAQNVKDAKDLLSAAGAADLSFKMIGNVDRYGAEAKQIWELVTASFNQAGLKVELIFQEYASYIQSTFLGKMDAGTAAIGPFIGSANDPDDILFSCYHTSAPRHNWGGTPIQEQADIDAMAVKQRTILDQKERIAYLQDFQRKMADIMLTVPYHASAGYVYQAPWIVNGFLKAGYAYIPDGYMKSWFTKERIAKG